MKDLIVTTVLYNYPDHIAPIFVNSANKRFGEDSVFTFRFQSHDDHEYKVFSNGENDYYSKLYFFKITKLKRELERLANVSSHILFMDALDTAILRSKDDILERYKAYGADIVIGAERGLWPVTDWSKRYDDLPKETDTFYLNSGTYIGRTEAILDALDKIEKHGRDGVLEDQGAWSRLYLMNEANLVLDQQRKLFFSTHESKDLLNIDNNDFRGFKIHDPCIVHDNGPHNEEKTFKLANHFANR